jgi:hypothetical protein
MGRSTALRSELIVYNWQISFALLEKGFMHEGTIRSRPQRRNIGLIIDIMILPLTLLRFDGFSRRNYEVKVGRSHLQQENVG